MPKTQTMAELAAVLGNWRRPRTIQAAFRLAQSRDALHVDEAPHTSTIWDFSQCLLAEAETLVLMNATATSPSEAVPLTLKVIDAGDAKKAVDSTSGVNGKGKGGATADVPCKWLWRHRVSSWQAMPMEPCLGQHPGQSCSLPELWIQRAPHNGVSGEMRRSKGPRRNQGFGGEEVVMPSPLARLRPVHQLHLQARLQASL